MNIYSVTPKDIEANIINLHNLVFEVTDICNLRCEYCVYSGLYNGFDERCGKHMSFDKARIVLDYLIDVWWKNRNFISYRELFVGFYGGEPLLNIELIKYIINYLESNCGNIKKIIYTMTTNALLLDKYMDYLVEKNILLLISLDGDKNGNSYRKTIGGKNSFDLVYNNVLKLKNKYPDYFEANVNFNSVLTSRTSLDEIDNFFHENFNKTPRVSEINCNNIKKECKSEFVSMYQSKQDSISRSFDRKSTNKNLFLSSPEIGSLINYIFHHTGNTFFAYNDLFIDRENAKIVPTSTCVPFQKKMFVTVNGKILQCEKISHKYALANIGEDSINFDFDKIANDFNNNVKVFIDKCKVCYLSKKCSLCVYQADLSKNMNTSCPNYCTEKQYKQYIDLNIKYLKKNAFLYDKILNEVILK